MAHYDPDKERTEAAGGDWAACQWCRKMARCRAIGSGLTRDMLCGDCAAQCSSCRKVPHDGASDRQCGDCRARRAEERARQDAERAEWEALPVAPLHRKVKAGDWGTVTVAQLARNGRQPRLSPCGKGVLAAPGCGLAPWA